MRANRHFSDAILERQHSVSVSLNLTISPSAAFDLESPLEAFLVMEKKRLFNNGAIANQQHLTLCLQ